MDAGSLPDSLVLPFNPKSLSHFPSNTIFIYLAAAAIKWSAHESEISPGDHGCSDLCFVPHVTLSPTVPIQRNDNRSPAAVGRGEKRTRTVPITRGRRSSRRWAAEPHLARSGPRQPKVRTSQRRNVATSPPPSARPRPHLPMIVSRHPFRSPRS